MARVVHSARQAGLDPLRHSQPLGAALVFLGLASAMPVMHGSKGCASFAKALLTRHFNEPIPLQTTGVTEVTAVLGSGEDLVLNLDAIRAKQRPEIIGLLTTGVTEVSGEDVAGQLREYLKAMERAAPEDAPLIVGVSTPDFLGGLSDGWSAALRALVSTVPFDGTGPARGPATERGTERSSNRSSASSTNRVPTSSTDGTANRAADEPANGRETVAVLVGPTFTAADLDELSALIQAFGMEPLLVPDLSGSLDGHLAPAWKATTTGGTPLARLRRLDRAGLVIAAGATATEAGLELAKRTGADLLRHDHLSGLPAVDALVADLLARVDADGGRARAGFLPSPEVRRARARLADGLLDAHFVLGGARVALAMEPETLVAVGSLLHDVGAEIVAAVSPTPAPVLADAPWDEVVIGDLTDLEERAAAGGAELIAGSSHVRAVADRVGAAHLPVGFPIYDRLGSALRSTSGYGGSLRLLVDAANRLLDHHHDAGHGARADRHGAQRRPFDERRPIDPFDQLDVLCQESPC